LALSQCAAEKLNKASEVIFQELCSAIFGEEFEGATMTRIGRCQIKTRHLSGNASYRRDKLAPLKIPSQTDFRTRVVFWEYAELRTNVLVPISR
jgi:hypothetical protein